MAWILVPVLILLVTLLASVSALVFADKQAQIDNHLQREATELRLLADRAIDPSTDKKFTSAKSLLQLYINRTVPDPNETMFVISDGLVFARSADAPPVRLDIDADFLALVNTYQVAEFGDYRMEYGQVRYIVVPVRGYSDDGALVAAVFSDLEFAPIQHLLVQISILALALLAGVAVVGWLVAHRVLRPVRELTQTTSEITSRRLNRRIETSGIIEFDALVSQFNSMLDRIQQAIASQKRFIDDAGHELRTPITIIRGHLELLESDPSQAETSMAIVKDELDRLSRLVSDLQTLTKSEAPGFVQLREVELKALAFDIAQKAKSLTEIEVETQAPTASWTLDPQRITQAVLQLVENASKHTPKDGKILVSFLADTDLQIVVEDSGSGIAKSEWEHIWEPFHRAKGTQNIEGSGIGLSIVASIVSAHGGLAAVSDSSLGGASIKLSIPRS